MSNPKSWDEYEIKARYIPCFVTAVPLVHFLIQLLGSTFWETIANDMGWLLITNAGLSIIVTLAIIQLQCGIAKHWIEESVFGKGGINFPTTNSLLFQDKVMSRSIKKTIREKIIKDFRFALMDEVKESQDILEAKKIIREAVSFIRVYVGKGKMTHKYNIRYGFIRNLMGGTVWAFLGSIGSGVIYGLQKRWEPMALFILCALIFFAILIFKKQILSKYAQHYAEILLSEYITMKGDLK
ncbi:MAG: hypothetical protein WCO53_01455 [Deltaproteobacteria bacterium]